MAQDIQAQQHGSTSQNSGGAAAGVAGHRAKMARQASQLKGAGATTGGLGTAPGSVRVSNRAGKFLSKGKN